MNVNCVNIEREKESLNITNINLLVRFNKTQELFPSVTRVMKVCHESINASLLACIH